MSLTARATSRDRAALVAAAVVAALLLACASVLRLAVGVGGPLPDRMVPVLIGAALLLAGLLALPRLAGLAWAALALAALIGALEVVAVVRSLESLATGNAWRDLALMAALALVGAALVAAAYAGRNPGRASTPARAAILVVGIGVLVTGALAARVVLGDGPRPLPLTEVELTPLRIAARVALATIAGALVLGAVRTVGPAAMRASARSRTEPADRDGGRLWLFLGLLADELLPARAEGRRRVAESERARLAADLHAHVLPELRRAAAAADSAGVPDDVRLDLRRALEDVEQLMHERQSIVLEQFGLVAALEWLAERAEERSRIRVELELDGAIPEGPAAIDPAVARAAFRIALLGLDNVVRHADASLATIRLGGDSTGLRLSIEDDGPAPTTFEATPGRGIPDMRSAATGSGGSIRFLSGTGARIEATWPAHVPARNQAPALAPQADRRDGAAT